MTQTLSPSDVARAQAGAYLGLFCVGLWITSFGPALPFLARGNCKGSAGTPYRGVSTNRQPQALIQWPRDQ